MNIEITTRTIEQRGIELPWQHKLESGTVFIPLSTLEELADRGPWDSQFGRPAFLLDDHEGLALVAAGFAVQETKGGFYSTDELHEWLTAVEARLGGTR